jgi:hypothetical protein
MIQAPSKKTTGSLNLPVKTLNSLKIYVRLASSTGKVFEKVILNILKRHIGERNLLNASQFGFRARHSTTLQCMRLADHVTLHFNSNMSTAAVFFDIEKTFDTTWQPGLLYKLSKLQFTV